MSLNPADYTNAAFLTATDVKQLINVVSGDVAPVCLAFLLDENNQPRNVIPLRDGTLTNELTKYMIGCTWRKNGSEAVQKSADLLFRGDVARWIRSGRDRIRLYRVYRDNKGNEISRRFPIATFLTPIADRDIYDRERYYTMKVWDETWKLAGLIFLYDYVAPRGLPYTCLLRTLTQMDYRSPADGGRQPSGIIVPCATTAPATGGNPIGKSVQAFTVCSRSSIDGFWHSPPGPYGSVLYSSYDGTTADVLHPGNGFLPDTAIDSVTYAPYSPWTSQPMLAIPGMTPEFFLEPVTRLFFKPQTGEFSLPKTFLGIRQAVDPFKQPFGPYPGGLQVQQGLGVRPGTPFSIWDSFGTIHPPLGTFPNDYDGSGPYYQTSPSTPITTTGAVILPSSSGVLGPIPGFAWARRYGDGYTNLVPSGLWSGSPPVSTPDPAHPSTNSLTPAPYNGQEIVGPSVEGWSFPAGVWEITFSLSSSPAVIGPPLGNGGASATVDVLVGGSTVLGNIPAAFKGFSAGGLITLVATGTLRDFTGGPGEHLKVAINIDSTPLSVTLDAASGYSFGTINFSDISFTKHPDATVPPGVTYVPPSPPAVPLVPVNGPTGMPYPDSNNPGLAPSGCPQEGPNIPPERVNIPDWADTLPVAMTFNRRDGFQSAYKQISEALFAYGIVVGETDIWTIQRKPYYLSDGLPPVVWRFSNERRTKDGKIIGPITERVIDESQAANVIFAVGEKNTRPTTIFAKRTNDALNSNISRAIIKRTIHKLIETSTIGNQDEANAAADLAKQEGAEGTDSVSFKTHGQPCLGPGDAIDIYFQDPITKEVIIDSATDGNPYIVESIETIELADSQIDGTSTITCSRAIAL